jgi:hypothetical protein
LYSFLFLNVYHDQFTDARFIDLDKTTHAKNRAGKHGFKCVREQRTSRLGLSPCSSVSNWTKTGCKIAQVWKKMNRNVINCKLVNWEGNSPYSSVLQRRSKRRVDLSATRIVRRCQRAPSTRHCSTVPPFSATSECSQYITLPIPLQELYRQRSSWRAGQ